MKNLKLGLILLSLYSIIGCGTNLGSGTTNGDARPNGTVVAQGELTGLNGQTSVTGSVLVFQSGTSFILRLEDFTFPSETGLRILLYGNNNSSDPVFASSLRQTAGAQNYTFTNTTTSTSYTTFYLYSTQTQKNYATSQLIKPNK